jgi:hypothetical protein
MSKFREIAEAAHEESQKRVRAQRAKREAAVAAATRAFEADVALLKSRILPLLLEAGEACAAVGAPPQMKDNFKTEIGVLGAPAALIEFWCAGPIQSPSRGSAMVAPRSEKIELRCYRGALTIGGDSFERAEPVEDDPKAAVEAALVNVLRTFFLDAEAKEAA